MTTRERNTAGMAWLHVLVTVCGCAAAVAIVTVLGPSYVTVGAALIWAAALDVWALIHVCGRGVEPRGTGRPSEPDEARRAPRLDPGAGRTMDDRPNVIAKGDWRWADRT